MNSVKSLIFSLGGVFILSGIGISVIYHNNQKRDDNFAYFAGVREGNPRISIKFKGVSLHESGILRESMGRHYPEMIHSGNLSSYYELANGNFNFNIERRGALEALRIADYVIQKSKINLR